MTEKSSKSNIARSAGRRGQLQPDAIDRIQPVLKLSELAKASGAISAQQAAIKLLSELSKSSEVIEAISAQQAAIKHLSELSRTSEVTKAISAQEAAIKQLSELSRTSEVAKVISAQEAAIKQLSELSKSSEVMKAISAQQAAIKRLSELRQANEVTKAISAAEQVRSSLQLQHLETAKKRATEAAANLFERSGRYTTARDVAKAAASFANTSIEPASRSPLSVERLSESVSAPITSARDLGQVIREVRQRRKLSQQAFADLVGVGRRFISELENGKATLEFDKVLQVASASGIDVLTRRRQ